MGENKPVFFLFLGSELRVQWKKGIPAHVCWLGASYAQLMLHLYVTVCLATAFPILLPIGLTYFVVKHLIDLARSAH